MWVILIHLLKHCPPPRPCTWAAVSSTLLLQDAPPNSRPRMKFGWCLRHVTSPPGRESVFKHFGGTNGLCVAQPSRVADFPLLPSPNPSSPGLGVSLMHLQPRGPQRCDLEESQGLGLSQGERSWQCPGLASHGKAGGPKCREVGELVQGCPEMREGASGQCCRCLAPSEPFLPFPSVELCSATTATCIFAK